MAMDNDADGPPTQDTSTEQSADGSFAAKHPERAGTPIVAGPATADEKNAIRDELDVIACWRLDDIHFDFDSCFVRPEANGAFRLLAALRKDHPNSVLSIFGHADPVGNDGYNKQLSGRRALAVYSILIRDVDKWAYLYGADNWGGPQIIRMLDALSYAPGEKDGLRTGAASESLKAFQSGHGESPSGSNTPATRKKLFKAYMDRLCGPGLQLDKKKDFLAGGADDHDRRGDVQGCSEFNPLVILSKGENSDFSKPGQELQRNAANSPDRRVLVFLFREGTKVDPADWPCPKADTTEFKKCEERFWSNGRERLQAGEKRRSYAKGDKTFACRFYDRICDFSPCENPGDVWVVRILQAGQGSILNHKPLANEPFTLEGVGGGRPAIEGRTDQNGVLRATVVDNEPTMTLRIAGAVMTLQGGALVPIVDDNAVRERLYNLGYGDGDYTAWTDDDLSSAITAFQHDHHLNESGQTDSDTNEMIQKMHGS
jgi:hypothetical protein